MGWFEDTPFLKLSLGDWCQWVVGKSLGWILLFHEDYCICISRDMKFVMMVQSVTLGSYESPMLYCSTKYFHRDPIG